MNEGPEGSREINACGGRMLTSAKDRSGHYRASQVCDKGFELELDVLNLQRIHMRSDINTF